MKISVKNAGVDTNVINKRKLICTSPHAVTAGPGRPNRMVVTGLFSLLGGVLTSTTSCSVRNVNVKYAKPLSVSGNVLLSIRGLPALGCFPLGSAIRRTFPLQIVLSGSTGTLVCTRTL